MAFCQFLLACKWGRQEKVKPQDSFYTDKGGLDLQRIPLIKPYEAKNWGGDWRIELQTTQLLELSIHNIKEINVVDSLVLVYAKGKEVSIKDVKYEEAWFVLIPKENSENGFTNRNEFMQFLLGRGIKSPVFHEVNSVYKEFVKADKINW
jgi:hypothetical protein